MRWYIIYRVWRQDRVTRIDELDAVMCEGTTEALRYARNRHRLSKGEILRAEACLTTAEGKRALAMHNQHALDDQVNDWTEHDWKEFVSVPTYEGNQDKYLRT